MAAAESLRAAARRWVSAASASVGEHGPVQNGWTASTSAGRLQLSATPSSNTNAVLAQPHGPAPPPLASPTAMGLTRVFASPREEVPKAGRLSPGTPRREAELRRATQTDEQLASKANKGAGQVP